MGMMSLTLRIRFWSVNRYLAERKTGHLDAERAARKPRRPASVRRGRWRRASRGARPRPRRDHRASCSGKSHEPTGKTSTGPFLYPSVVLMGTLARVACRLPSQTPSTTWETGSTAHFPGEAKRGGCGCREFPIAPQK